uniref:Transcriptional regulator, HxlR family n=1 Tax=Sphingobacterium sp. (strain 21) TaxID=743722 RepID=F4C6D7_SPHS2
MYIPKIEKHYDCGIKVTMDIIGGKWKPCIINNIYKGIKRPSDLQRAIPYASRRSLNTQLSELIEHGVIQKKVYPVLPLKVEYELTEFGNCLLPLTLHMEQWGNEHKDQFFAMLDGNAVLKED